MDMESQVVGAARAKDPSLEPDLAVLLAGEALPLAVDGEDAPQVARELLRRHPDLDPSAANVVAVAAVEAARP